MVIAELFVVKILIVSVVYNLENTTISTVFLILKKYALFHTIKNN